MLEGKKGKKVIYETIVTTVDADNHPHIAPFGVSEKNGLIVVAPFHPSKTLDNLLVSRNAVLNLTDDVRIFAGMVTGRRRTWPMHKAHKISGFVLDAALAHRELSLVEVKEHATRPEFYLRVEHEVNHMPFRGFNRAQAAVIELSVLVSRLHILPMEKIEAELVYLNIAIGKTSGERELEAWGWLIEYMENHKAGLEGKNIA
jgi:hypothetical protein